MHQAKDIMTSAIISVSPDSSLNDAMELIIANRISGLLVIDDAGGLVGILSEADRIRLLVESETPDDGASVAQYMTRNVISVKPDTELAEIAELLMRSGIRRVPVVDNGDVLGLISRHDLMCAITKEKGSATNESLSGIC
jgi:CBS domain-containing protein